MRNLLILEKVAYKQYGIVIVKRVSVLVMGEVTAGSSLNFRIRFY